MTLGSSTTQYIPPYATTVKFDEVLPNVGVTYAITDTQSIYASYAGGLSAPRTDSLYTAKRLASGGIGRANPEPEQTDSIDLGWRYRGERLLASVALWQSEFKNRIVEAFDQDLGITIDRNVGDVELRGVDLQVGWQANDWIVVNGSASYNNSELKDDLRTSATAVLSTAGKQLVETPEWTVAGRLEMRPFEGFNLGFEGKFVDERFTTDINDAKVEDFTVYSLDAGYNFVFDGVKAMRVQLNVYNLFDEQFFGSLSTRFTAAQSPSLSLGAPRTVSLSLQTRF